jgi:hypothetical protein
MKVLKLLILMGAATLIPTSLLAQQTDPVTRLQSVLPADVAARVIPLVQDAMSHDLPGDAVANVALQGVAMGRSGDQVRAAAEAMVSELRAAHDALSEGGRAPTTDETQAGALAMQQGVDGATVSALAKSAPSGRSLAVPLAVMGALVDRGLPAADALQAVQERLQNRSSDQQIAELPAGAGQMLAQGMKPAEVGTALAGTRAGFTVPASGVSVPAGGAPSGVTANGGVAGKRPTGVGRGSHGKAGGGI